MTVNAHTATVVKFANAVRTMPAEEIAMTAVAVVAIVIQIACVRIPAVIAGVIIPKRAFSRSTGSIEITDLIYADGYKMPIYFQDTRDFVSFLICGPNAEAYNFIYSKRDNKGIRVSATNSTTFPIKFSASDSEYFYTVYARYGTYEGMEERIDPITRYLVKKYGFLAEGENPRIIGIKFDFKSL